MAKVALVDVKKECDVSTSLHTALGLLGGIRKYIKKGDTVMVKPNYNSDDPPPASSDPEFVKAVISEIRSAGASKVVIGESSGPFWKPTMKVLKKTGLLDTAKDIDVEVIDFDNSPYVYKKMPDMQVEGHPLIKGLHMPESLYKYDRLIYICCMKTHMNARFTMATKLAMGYPKMLERYKMHAYKLEPKIAELNLLMQPDLILMDGRKAFVTGGPHKGRCVKPGCFLASTDRVAIDVEALKILKSYDAKNQLNMPIEDLPLISECIRLGIGKPGELVKE